MDKIESIEEFYKRKFGWMPDNIRNEIGHFNVFRLDPFVASTSAKLAAIDEEITKAVEVQSQAGQHSFREQKPLDPQTYRIQSRPWS